MPNIKSAKKRVKTINKRKEINNNFKATMKNAIKRVDNACKAKDGETATNSLKIAIKIIDKVLSKGLIHKNTASRYKSRLTKNVNNLK